MYFTYDCKLIILKTENCQNNIFQSEANIMNLNKLKNILPGFIICIAIANISKYLGAFIPTIGSATLSIIIGIITRNTICTKKIYHKGSKFAESNLLSYSIVLLGGTLSVKTILNLGIWGVGFILTQMTITIISALFIGKFLGFSNNFRYLMASGNAVCGSSAIGATAPILNASDDEKIITITIVNLTGTILMLLLPIFSKILFHSDTVQTSAFIGGILQSVGQVVASGSMVNDAVKDLATIFKIVRIIFLIFVVIILGNLKKRTLRTQERLDSKPQFKVPWYVIGFFVMCCLFTLGFISPITSNYFKMISNNFEIIALAGIGMRINFKELIKQGLKSSMYGLCVGTLQVISAILIIYLFLN